MAKIIACLSTLFLIYSCGPNKNVSYSKDDLENRIDSLLDKSFAYLKKDLSLSLKLSQEADSLSRISNYQTGLARSLRSQAYNSYFNNKPEQTLGLFDQAERLELKQKNYKGLISTYNSKAWLFKNLNLYDDALKYYKDAISLQDSLIDEVKSITSYNNIANIYTYLSRHDSALIYFNEALILAKTINDTLNTAVISTNLGNTHSLLLNYDVAEEYFLQALAICQNPDYLDQKAKVYNNLGALYYEKNEDSLALYYYEKSIGVKSLLQDSFALAKSYFNVAELYSDKGEYSDIADKYLRASELIFRKVNEEDLSKIFIYKADRFKQNGQFFQEKTELQKAETLLESSSEIATKAQVYKNLAEVLYALGENKLAFEKYQQYVTLNDSILNEEKFWRVAEQEKKHLIKIKQNEISLLEKDNIIAVAQTAKKQEENKKLLFSLGGAILIVALLALFIIYFNRLRKTESKLAAQQETILKKEMQNLVNEQELHIVSATLNARKKEKEIISKELHNNIGSLLTSAKFHFQSFDEDFLFSDISTKNLYLKTTDIIDNVIEEIRSLSHRFDRDSLPGFNLKYAVKEFLGKVDSKKLSVQSTIHGLDSFQNTEVSIFIFRVLQELVNNVIKHAHASQLIVYITRNTDGINIMVEDNGKGFDTYHKHTGIGLRNLNKQVDELNGECFIDSNPDLGTTININIPISKKT